MTRRPLRILLQTTIPGAEDDWNVRRFSVLQALLQSEGHEVTARDRSPGGDDAVLGTLDASDFDELWLLAADSGGGLTAGDIDGISRFHRRGGGLLVARDHEDVGSSVCELEHVGEANHFHSRRLEPDEARRVRDDVETRSISWPNYHSGRNGDFQAVVPVEPAHELLLNPAAASGIVEYFPAHPHEGAVGIPPGEEHARIVATGRSAVTGRPFNLLVAFDAVGGVRGRAVAESSFHHFADYNWDVAKGAPSFVSEPPGDGVARCPERLAHVSAYVRNLARWLAPSQPTRRFS